MVEIEWLWTNQNVQGVGRPLGFRTQKSLDERSKELDVSLGLLVSLTFRNNLHQQQPEPRNKRSLGNRCNRGVPININTSSCNIRVHTYIQADKYASRSPVILQRRPSSYAHHSIGEHDRDRQIPF